jgi:hypothetical protein
VSEQPEDIRSVATTKQRMRPRPAGNGWALVVVATVVVILLGLGTWVGLSPLQTLLSSPSDHEAVHAVAARMRARWPQAPGPPERYLDEAAAAVRAGDGTAAARKLGMAIALDANQTEALLALTILDARGASDGLLQGGEADAVVGALSEAAPDARLLPAAQAWRLLAGGQGADVESLLGPLAADEPEEQLWARVRGQRAAGLPEGAAARALLRAWPGHPEACEDGAREALRAGELAEAEALAGPCLGGPAGAIAARVQADVLARTEGGARAREAYRAAGLTLHAAAVAVRAGLPLTDDEWAALAEPGPPAAVQQAWAAMAAGDAALLDIAAARLPTEPVPEIAVTRAAAALWSGDAERARAALEGVAGPRAAVLRAQLPGEGQAAAAARAAWPALPGGEDPVATALLFGPSDHAIPTRLLLAVGERAGAPLDAPALAGWTPADARAGALVRWLRATPSAAPPTLVESGEGDVLDLALEVAAAVAAGGDAATPLARLQARAPERVVTDVLTARAAPSGEACVEAVVNAQARMPGLVGLDRERYLCRVRGGPATRR